MRLATLANRQSGVVCGRQLRDLGFSPEAIGRASRTGRLHRIHRDVYAVGHLSLKPHAEALGAVFAGGNGALLSHRGAAWLWGLAAVPSRWDVTMPGHRRQRGGRRARDAGARPAANDRSQIVVHRSRSILDADRDVRRGVPLTALPRTLLDLAAVLPMRHLIRAIEAAEHERILNLDPILKLLERTRGHHGHGPLRRAISIFAPDPAFTREELERRFVELVRSSSLPMPLINTYEESHEIDAFWPDARLAVELQGYEFHSGRAAFERDARRIEDLAVAGIGVIPVTWRRLLDDPDGLLEHLAQLLSDRRPT